MQNPFQSLMCQHSKAALNCNCWKGFLKSLLYAGIHSPFAVCTFTANLTAWKTFHMGYAVASAAVSRLEVLVLSSKKNQLLLVLFSVLLCILLGQDATISFPLLCAGQQSGQELMNSLTAFFFQGVRSSKFCNSDKGCRDKGNDT